MSRASWVSSAAFLFAAACIPADETELPGSVAFEIRGSEPARTGTPVAGFADGWTFTFDRVLLASPRFNLSAKSPRGWCGGEEVKDSADILDARAPYAVIVNGLRPGPCEHTSLSFSTDGSSLRPGPAVTTEDLALIVRAGVEPPQGVSVSPPPAVAYVAGRGVRAGVEIKVALQIDFAYDGSSELGCSGEKDGRLLEGVVVVADERETIPVTFAAERLFADTVGRETGALRFDAIAGADADHNGTVTFAELEGVPLAPLAKATGAYVAPSYVANVAGFLRLQAARAWRFRERGWCEPVTTPSG